MKSYFNFISESKDKYSEDDIKFVNKIFKYKDIGEIRYRIYEDDVVIFMGSYVDKDYRGKGIFKMMINELLPNFDGKEVYIPLSNPIIINMFKDLGFVQIKEPIRYWGKPNNSVNVYKKF
jgi:GNAT superfamily N-acetyltransferase